MPSKLSLVAALIQRLNLACAFLAGIALLLMMVAGAADIIGSNLNWLGLSSRPIPGMFEFIGTMMVVSVFMAVALGQARRVHIKVELFVHMLPDRWQKAAEAMHHVFTGAFFALICWAAWPAAAHSFRVGEFSAGLINFPIWPARAFLAFGATLMTVQCVLDVLGVFDPRFRVPDRHSGESATV